MAREEAGEEGEEGEAAPPTLTKRIPSTHASPPAPSGRLEGLGRFVLNIFEITRIRDFSKYWKDDLRA